MSTAEAVQSRPRLRSGVVLGPATRRGDTVVHHVKDPLTGWYYRIGPREYFLLSRMDGTRTLEELSAAYLHAFGRQLGPASWQQLFGMLYRRQLLDGATDEQALAQLTASAAAGAARAKRGPMQARFPLFDPDRLFNRVGPALAPLFNRWFVIPALLAVVALAGYVGYEWSALNATLGSGRRSILTIALAVLIAWAIIFLHECAHGLTCWHYGGQVKEIGLMWRFPLLAPYCKVDDVVLLSRGQRIATAFAGVFVSMLALLPVAVIWRFSTSGTVLYDLTGSLLLFGTVAAGMNLVPFLRLDGYYMLTHALNLTDLRTETYRFYGRLMRGGPGAVAGYPRRDQVAYALYGLASVIFVGVLGTLLVRLWYTSLRGWVGSTWAVTILVAEAVLLGLFFWYALRRSRRKAAAAGTTGSPTATTDAAS